MKHGRYWNGPRPLSAPTKRHVLEHLADMQDVTTEHFLEVVMARKQYRKSKEARERSRRRALARTGRFKPRRKGRVSDAWLFAGEGRFHELLKLAGMTAADFASVAGLDPSTVRAWYGFPMHGWPVRLLELIVWQKNATSKLDKHGYPPEMFNAGKLPIVPDGRFPRTTAQGRALIAGVAHIEEGQ